MVVITKVPPGGVSGLGYIPSQYSPTMQSAANIATVNQSLRTSGDWSRIARRGNSFLGLGDAGTEPSVFSSIPLWAYLAAGGLAAGLIGGLLVFKKRRR